MGSEINVGVVVDGSPETDVEALERFAKRLVEDVRHVLTSASGVEWAFSLEEPAHLSNDAPRRPSDFLDEASLRMAEGPFDMVVVITDVALSARGRRVVPGLASQIARIAIVSTRKLVVTPRGQPLRTLDHRAVRFNAAALLLHLIGHMIGLRKEGRERGTVMAPFHFDPDRRTVPEFGERSRRELARRARAVPEREYHGTNPLGKLGFHMASALRNPGQVFLPLLRNRAPVMALSLPGLATAALAPTFILIFTAEIWDVGLNLTRYAGWIFAAASILASTWYLTAVQDLFFPRKEKRIVTEHMAVVNATIFLTMLMAVIGLFVLVGLLMLFIESYIFPPQLIENWPTVEEAGLFVTFGDKLRIAGFISSIGVITGALAGGLTNRAVIRHLALFREEP